jgi:hypothetical protein
MNTGVVHKFIALDIVNNCNLRCPFCVVDYSRVNKTDLMTEETFRRMLLFIDTVPEAGFWLSCLHEPTLHPKLSAFLTMIPREARKKVFFTTNLTRALSEGEFALWAESGIKHINVSLDTLDAALFPALRRGGSFAIFRKNLDTIARVFRQYPDAPKLRYMTLTFRQNRHEIPEIVRQTHERYFAFENEIRFPYNMSHFTDQFRREYFPHASEWIELTASLKNLPYRYVVSPPPDLGCEAPIPSGNNFDLGGETGLPMQAPTLPLGIAGRHDGTLMVDTCEQRYRINVNFHPDPVGYFDDLRRSISASAAPVTQAQQAMQPPVDLKKFVSMGGNGLTVLRHLPRLVFYDRPLLLRSAQMARKEGIYWGLRYLHSIIIAG